MPHRLLSLLVLLLLPGLAHADPAALGGLDEEWAPRSTQASAAEPALDLSFEPPAAALRPRTSSSFPRGATGKRAVVSSTEATSRGRAPQAPFSVGLDIRTRHEVGDEAREQDPDQATLADEVTGIVERSTFGLTGTYRF